MLLYGLLLMIPMVGLGQWQVAQWAFGMGVGLDFRCSPPRPFETNASLGPIEGGSSICDANGKLLLYTDGYYVWNGQHQLVQYGSDIGSGAWCFGSSTQNSLIVPQPGNDSLFYIFTTDCAENVLAEGFCYSIVNMNRNGGAGEVILSKQQLLPKVCEKVAAVHHFNDNSIWIVTHEWGNDKFDAYLLNSGGLVTTPVVSQAGRVQLPLSNPIGVLPECAARGSIKFSTQGDRLVVFSFSDCHSFVSNPELFTFDNATGQITYEFVIPLPPDKAYYSGSFSPDGSVLYCSEAWKGGMLRQFDLSLGTPSAIAASERDLGGGIDEIGAVQIGPDGKIYCAPNGSDHLSVIHDPNVYGPGCNFVLNGININRCGSGTNSYGLPNHIETYYRNPLNIPTCASLLFSDFTALDSCLGQVMNFHFVPLMDSSSMVAWRWTFGDGASSLLRDPQHTYLAPGTYTVRVVAYADTARLCPYDTVEHAVTVVACGTATTEALPAEITLFPNPARDRLFIGSTIPIDAVEVLDLQGRRLMDVRDDHIASITLRLPDGLYLARLWSDAQLVLQQKFIVLGDR